MTDLHVLQTLLSQRRNAPQGRARLLDRVTLRLIKLPDFARDRIEDVIHQVYPTRNAA